MKIPTHCRKWKRTNRKLINTGIEDFLMKKKIKEKRKGKLKPKQKTLVFPKEEPFVSSCDDYWSKNGV